MFFNTLSIKRLGKGEGMEINLKAPVVVKKEMFIRSSPSLVWAILADVKSWHEWLYDVGKIEIKKPLEIGSHFRWSTLSLAMISTIQDLVPNKRISWTSKGSGMRSTQTWVLTPKEDGTLVVSEQSMQGLLVGLFKDRTKDAVEQAITAWLKSLKRQAESGKGKMNYSQLDQS
jgi:uncharacterized protein YndB with AHSA1/START domain